jgi:hypothetical protein
MIQNGKFYRNENCLDESQSFGISNNRYNPDYHAQDFGDQPNYYFQSAP